MAITVTTHMRYTRLGEAESDVLSAHDPLIWEWQESDGAIDSATIEFIVKDNLVAVIYTSAVFSAYLYDDSGPVLFRFDATQIIKHIIDNYFYKETAEIIEPENYGSFLEVTIKTYDGVDLEDTEVLEYFACHAVNQIGDEYGTNIPRMFLNDTEEIAHFLGFPNHLFFYALIDLAAEDSIIEFLTREAMIEFLYSSATLAHPDLSVVGASQHNPSLWYYNKKTYGVWMKREGAGYNVDSMIFAFDHETGKISASHYCNTGVVGGTDPHAYPSVIVADDGHIIVVREELSGVGGNDHNSAMWINRSDNTEDESSWANALAFAADFFSEVGVTGGDAEPRRLAYPMLAKTLNGNLYLWARSGDDQEEVRIFQSQDDGKSWDGFGTGETDGLIVMTFPLAWGYNSQIKHTTDTKLYMIVNPWNTVDARNRVYFLWSTDGITWRNVDDSWSKNISAVAAITEAEAEANLLVCGADTPEIYYFNSGYIDDNGYPHLLVTRSLDAGVNYFLSYYYWDGSAWLHNDFNVPDFSSVASTSILYQKAGHLEIMVKRAVDGKNIFSIYKSSDYFKSMTLVKHIDPENTINYAAITFNREATYNTFLFHHYNTAAASDMYIYAEADIFEEFGTLGLYIHDLDLSKFTLNKDIYQCKVYYDPAAPELIKTYNLHIFEPCENAVYIRFLTKDGYYMYWAFSSYPYRSIAGDKLGSVINNFSEMALANSRNFPIGYRNAFNKIDVIASVVPIVFRRKLMDLFTSPGVYMWKGSLGGYEYETDWILLNRVEGSHTLREKMGHDNFECTLVLPENYTQQLSGQNI